MSPRKATNYVSNKSNFFGNVHYNYLNYSFLNEHFKREKIKLELYNSIKERKKISSKLIDNLKNYKLTILSKKHNSQLLEYENKINFSNGDVLTVFDDKIFEKSSYVKILPRNFFHFVNNFFLLK